jgi:hypothetical protein
MAKKRPTKLTVGCYDYEILWQKCPDKTNIGWCEPAHLRITIDPSMNPMVQISTLVHELLHAGSDFIGLTPDPALEESIVTRMSGIVVSMLRDNPDVVEYITRKLE